MSRPRREPPVIATLQIEGEPWRVVLPGMRTLDGEIQPRKRIIRISSRLVRSGWDEVLLHELIHHFVPDLPEDDVERASRGLYGVLAGNGMWRSPFGPAPGAP